MLLGKKILLGISGSIAAYKCPALVRLLRKAGAEVKVVLSPAARDFVTPMTLATLSGHPVFWSFSTEEEDGANWTNHVELGLWADLMIIAPATSNTMSKMANATCDNLLMATYLSAKCPVYFAPAMDLDMYRHPGNQENMKRLESYGNVMIPAVYGELASGLVGVGRMAEPDEIVHFLENHLRQGLPLHGKKVMVTAGPTREAIDPVRFIGNHSSGKMGVALAREAARLGAEVSLILGPTSVDFDLTGLDVRRVTSAEEMYAAAKVLFPDADYAVFAAAVADYRPAARSDEKIKKSQETLNIQLEPTVDILGTLAADKGSKTVIGFALETQKGEEYALGKLKKKNLDYIVLNQPGARTGFGTETNQVTLFSAKDPTPWMSPLLSKEELAYELWSRFLSQH